MLLHDVINGPPGDVPDEGAAGNGAANRQSRPAIVNADDGETVSYGGLSERARAYAAWLHDLGLKRGTRVAIIAHKSPDVVAAFLGASRAGIVFVPLDIQASKSYWMSVLDEFKIEHVLTNMPDLADQLGSRCVHDLAACTPGAGRPMPVESAVGSREPFDDPSMPAPSPDDDAYILATSGSTGRPKGVVLSHRNAMAFVDWATGEMALGAGDKVLSVAPFHFDLSVFDIYGTLNKGAALVLPPAMATMFPGLLIKTIEDHEITVLYTVPTVLRMLLDSGAFAAGGAVGAGASLRAIAYAGEPYPAAALVTLMEALPAVTFYNFFGPTETNVSLAHCLNGPPSPDSEIPIGHPASGATITLVDDAGQPVKQGGIGEILVAGPSVMQGYLKADGFHPAGRPLATGDFARQGADGAYYFCGRRDSQVKLRGARIELAAVERALASADGVSDAVALVLGTELIAFVATKDAEGGAKARTQCADRLPPGSVPHKIVTLLDLPRLSNGKLDLAKLKALALEGG